MKGIFSLIACGPPCWEARDDICRCSCGGAHHGIRRHNRPGCEALKRQMIYQGFIFELSAVDKPVDRGSGLFGPALEVYGQAQEMNIAAGIKFLLAHCAKQSWIHWQAFASGLRADEYRFDENRGGYQAPGYGQKSDWKKIMNPNLNSPAFPLDGENAPTGLTKREYAAIRIAAAFVSNSHHHPEEIAIASIRIADALLERLRYQPGREPGAKSS